MLYKEAKTRLKSAIQKNESSDITDDRIDSAFAFAKTESGKAALWRGLKRHWEFSSIQVYKTGTATVTKDSRTVSFSGATLTSSMRGRFFKHGNTGIWREI